MNTPDVRNHVVEAIRAIWRGSADEAKLAAARLALSNASAMLDADKPEDRKALQALYGASDSLRAMEKAAVNAERQLCNALAVLQKPQDQTEAIAHDTRPGNHC